MKKLVMFSMWLVASAAAVGVAWAGVSVVDNQIVDPPSVGDFSSSPTILAGPDGQPTSTTVDGSSTSTAGNQVEDPSDEAATTPTMQTGSGNTGSNNTGSNNTGSGNTGSGNTGSGNTGSGNTGSSSPTTTTQPGSATTPTTQPPVSNQPAPTAAPASTQTFTLIGGTAAISFSASGVEVLWATANPGFDVKIEPESPGMKVEFRAEHHRSRLDAWWSDGPRSSTQEEPRD